jgi:hypothetical protein
VLNLGGYDLLPKPWTEESVTRLVQSAVRRWTRDREIAHAREINSMSHWRASAG